MPALLVTEVSGLSPPEPCIATFAGAPCSAWSADIGVDPGARECAVINKSAPGCRPEREWPRRSSPRPCGQHRGASLGCHVTSAFASTGPCGSPPQSPHIRAPVGVGADPVPGRVPGSTGLRFARDRIAQLAAAIACEQRPRVRPLGRRFVAQAIVRACRSDASKRSRGSAGSHNRSPSNAITPGSEAR
jgi:hypothetical protein